MSHEKGSPNRKRKKSEIIFDSPYNIPQPHAGAGMGTFLREESVCQGVGLGCAEAGKHSVMLSLLRYLKKQF